MMKQLGLVVALAFGAVGQSSTVDDSRRAHSSQPGGIGSNMAALMTQTRSCTTTCSAAAAVVAGNHQGPF